ncbi:MAG: hypothetical protein AAF939_06155 [Planctomycetota bacterium]
MAQHSASLKFWSHFAAFKSLVATVNQNIANSFELADYAWIAMVALGGLAIVGAFVWYFWDWWYTAKSEAKERIAERTRQPQVEVLGIEKPDDASAEQIEPDESSTPADQSALRGAVESSVKTDTQESQTASIGNQTIEDAAAQTIGIDPIPFNPNSTVSTPDATISGPDALTDQTRYHPNDVKEIKEEETEDESAASDRQELEDLRLLRQQLEQTVSRLEYVAERKGTEFQNLSQKFEEAQSQLQQLRKEKEAADNQSSLEITKANSILESLEQEKKNFKNLESEYLASLEQMDSIQSEVVELVQQVDLLNRELDENQSNFDRKEKNWLDRVNVLKKQLVESQSETDSLKEQLIEENSRKSEFQSELAHLQNQVNDQSKSEQSKSNLIEQKDKTIEQLETALEDLKAEQANQDRIYRDQLADRELLVQSSNEALQNLKTDLDSARSEVNKLRTKRQADFDQSEISIGQALDQVELLKSQAVANRADQDLMLDSILKSELATQKNESELQAQADKLQAQTESLSGELQQKQKAINEVEDKNLQLENELEDFREESLQQIQFLNEELNLALTNLAKEKKSTATESQNRHQLENDLAKTHIEIEGYQQKIKTLEKTEKHLNQKLVSLEKRLEVMTANQQQDQANYQEQLESLRHQKETLQMTLGETIESKASVDEQLEAAQATCRQQSKKVEVLSSEIDKFKQQAESLEAELKTNLSEVDRLNEIVAAIENKASNQRREASENSEQWNLQLHDLQTKLKQQQKIAENVNQVKDQAKQETEQLREQNKELEDLVSKLRHEIENLNDRSDKLESVESELEKERQKLNKLASELETSSDQSQTALDLHRNTKRDLQELRKQKELIEDRLQVTSNELDNQYQANKKLLANRDALKIAQSELRKLTEENEQIEKTKRTFENQVADLESRLEMSAQTMDDRTKELENAKHELMELRSQIRILRNSEKEFEIIRDQISDLDDKNKKQSTEQSRLLEILRVSEAQNVELENQLDQNTELLRKFESKIGILEETQNSKSQELISTRRKLNRAKKFIENLKHTIAEKNERLEKISSGNQVLDQRAKSSLGSLQKNITKKNQTIAQLENERQENLDSIDLLKTELEAERKNLELLNQKVNDQKSQYKDLLSTLKDDFTERIKQKNAVIRRLSDTLNSPDQSASDDSTELGEDFDSGESTS